MKTIRTLAFASLVVFAAGLIACGGDKKDDPLTGKEVLLADLEGTWTLDAANSQLANLDINTSGIGATFGETSFTLTGEITTYVSGGSYTISEEGVITAVDVDIEITDLELLENSLDVSFANDKVTVEFSTQVSEARVNGLGDFVLIFTKN